MLGLCVADAIRRLAEARYGPPEYITRAWTTRPYLTRWTVAKLPGGRKVFLHHFQDSDSDAMHNHPWGFTSVILAGGYWEKTPVRGWVNGIGPTREQWYGPGRVLIRPARWIHAVRLPDGKGGVPRPCWSLLYIGIKVRSWGFWCPSGFTPWREHLVNFYKYGSGCP